MSHATAPAPAHVQATAATETVKQEAARLGISLSEVRRRRNAATPRKEVLRLEDRCSYRNGMGKIVKVTLLPREKWTRFNDKSGLYFNYVGDDLCFYSIYNEVNGPLAKLNLIEKVGG